MRYRLKDPANLRYFVYEAEIVNGWVIGTVNDPGDPVVWRANPILITPEKLSLFYPLVLETVKNFYDTQE